MGGDKATEGRGGAEEGGEGRRRKRRYLDMIYLLTSPHIHKTRENPEVQTRKGDNNESSEGRRRRRGGGKDPLRNPALISPKPPP